MTDSARRERLRRALSHGSGGWLATLLASPFLYAVAALSRPVRRHSIAIAVAILALGVGSVATLVVLRRRLWTPSEERSVPIRRVGLVYLAILACAATVLAVGNAMPVRPRRAALDGAGPQQTPTTPSSEPTTPVPTFPSVTRTTSPPTAEGPKPLSLSPEKLDAVRLLEADVERFDLANFVDYVEGRGEQLFDPENVTLCTGLTLTTYPITLSTFNRFDGYDGAAFYASEVTLFESVTDAKALMGEIRSGLSTCAYHTRSGTRLGEETLRFWTTNEDGEYLDHILFRVRNLLVQVGTKSDRGNHATPADALAAICARNAARVT
jgi:hypothetical protein